jgi:hypothetical protein
MPDDDAMAASQAADAGADAPKPHPDDSEAHLSEAARGVIRQSADPRLDAHLARMLSETGSAPGRTREQDGEIARLTGELQAARAEGAAAARNAKTLMWLFAAAVVAIVILLVVLVLR